MKRFLLIAASLLVTGVVATFALFC